MSKYIAVYYCGGCNPRYDRVSAVRKLAKRFPDLALAPPDGTAPDGCLAVCGCTAGCAGNRLPAGYSACIMRSADDLAAVEQWLQAYENT